MDFKKLEKMISKYEYGQFSLLKNNFTIESCFKTKQIRINNYYSPYHNSIKGTCSELMNHAYLELKEKFSNFYFTRATGVELNYFNKFKEHTHSFLIISEKNILNNLNLTRNIFQINEILKQQNLLLYDPSFKKILAFSESNYKIKSLYGQNCKVGYPLHVVMENLDSIPLIISKKNELINLKINFKFKQNLFLKIQNLNGEIKNYPIISKILDEKFKNEEIVLKFLKVFRNKKVTKSKEKFERINQVYF